MLAAVGVGLGVGLGCTQPPSSSLVILAHPDDELAIVDYLLERGPAARLLFLTRGETSESPEGRGAEAEEARALYGSRSVELIGASDGELTLDPSVPWERWEVPALIDRVTRQIERDRPTEVVTWMPNIASVNGEHQLTGAIVTAAFLASRHRPRRILYSFESYKVGYYRMQRQVLAPEELGMRVERFRTEPLPVDRLAALYPSQAIHRWLTIEREAFLDGSRLASFQIPGTTLPLGPPRPEAPLPPGDYDVLPNFGAWLEGVGLESVGRVIALSPAPGAPSRGGVHLPLSTGFDVHEVRRELRNGVLYILLPRDVIELTRSIRTPFRSKGQYDRTRSDGPPMVPGRSRG